MHTYFTQKLLLNGVQPSIGFLCDDPEVVVHDHLAEEATASQQHGQVPIDAVAEGQHDDIRRELKKEFIKTNSKVEIALKKSDSSYNDFDILLLTSVTSLRSFCLWAW